MVVREIDRMVWSVGNWVSYYCNTNLEICPESNASPSGNLGATRRQRDSGCNRVFMG